MIIIYSKNANSLFIAFYSLMKKIIVILFIMIPLSLSAQSQQQQKVDSVFKIIVKYFNAKNADGIYNMAGENFQKEISFEAFNNLASKQLFTLGTLKVWTLLNFVNNNAATYKAKFDKITIQIQLSLDEKDKIELFLFQAYNEPAPNKTALVATSNPLKTSFDLKLDSIARTYIQKANTVGLCIGIINKDKTSIYSYGETIKRNGKLPDADNFFEIGSITKTFTATLLAYYANEGLVSLNDPITKYLPDSVSENPELKSITLLNLSNHTSGLEQIPNDLIKNAKDALNPYKNYGKEQIMHYLKTCKLQSKPGEAYIYSNTAVGLLGYILEKINGKTFQQMVTQIICKPLGMFSTDQYLNPLLAPRFVQVYNAAGEPTPAWDFDVLAPCGALRSTLNDLLIYTKSNMLSGNDKLSKAFKLTQKVTFTKDVKIGLAWHIILVNGMEYYFHNGDTYGSSSFLAFSPEKSQGVVILSNAAERTDSIGAAVLKALQ